MTVDYSYQMLLSVMRKNQAGGLSNEDYQRYFNAEQSAYLSDLLGRWQNRSNGKSGQNTGLVENETILTKLAPFTKGIGLNIVAGIGVKPTDFVFELAHRINNVQVQYTPKSQLAAMLTSVIDPPSEADDCYYVTDYLNYYSFSPSSVTMSDLDYIARPTDVVWGYTLDADDRQQYDPGTSVDPLWASEDVIEITRRCLKTLGVSFQDGQFLQYGQSIINSGS